MYFIFVILLILILIYSNWDIWIEKFNTYQTFQSFIPITDTIGITNANANVNANVNTYKYPAYPLVNPTFSSYWNGFFIPWSNGYTNLPWWNTSLGNTTNMSYDLRGDPLITPRTNFVWNNGTNFPIYNQPV